MRVEPFRASGSLLVRVVDVPQEWTETDREGQEVTMHGDRGGLTRLDTLRSLLEVVG